MRRLVIAPIHIFRVIATFALIAFTVEAWSQITITGTVAAKEDNSQLPGVNVVEKGTKNGTTTAIDGTFSLNVSNPNSTLVFSFIGMITQEYPLKGRDHVLIKIKSDCNKDFFDGNKIILYASSGMINTPIGGHVELASPETRFGTLNGGVGYQTNLSKNKFANGQFELKHFVSNCDFDMDVKWFYRRVSFNNNFDSRAYSVETDLNFSHLLWDIEYLKFIVGYSNLSLIRPEANYNQNSSGPLVGIGTRIGRPLYSVIVGKVAMYKGTIEYQGSMHFRRRRFYSFLKFYKLDSFTELSLGVGASIWYRLRKHRK